MITNDSDLAEPIKLARTEFGRDVYLLDPCVDRRQRSKHLMDAVGHARFYKKLRMGPISIAQSKRQTRRNFV